MMLMLQGMLTGKCGTGLKNLTKFKNLKPKEQNENSCFCKNYKRLDHWKSVFESDRHKQIRSDAGVNVVGYGYHPDTGRAYVVQEVGSMETMQKVMAENQDALDEVGVDMSTMQMIPLEG